MDVLLLNNELNLTVPAGFHVMTEAERGKLQMPYVGQWVGLSDPERHIIVTAGWKQAGGLAMRLLSGRDLAKNMEKNISKPLQPLGYKPAGSRERTIAGTPAQGFGYSYTAQETPMYGESYAMKRGQTVYYFHFYARAALREESLPVWEELLGSICEA